MVVHFYYTSFLASLFAVNASATIIPETYQTIVSEGRAAATYVDQDFEDLTANADLTTSRHYGRVTVEDGALRLRGEELTAEQLEAGVTPSQFAGAVAVDTPVLYADSVVTFDLRRNHEMTDEMAFYVALQREANAASEYASLKKYGALVPINVLEEDVWYEYEITFNEQRWIDKRAQSLASKDEADAVRDADGVIATAKMRQKGADTWTTLGNSGSNINYDAAKFRSNGSGIDACTTDEINFCVRSFRGVKTEGYSNTGIDVSVDNIKVFSNAIEDVYGTFNYDANSGSICLSKADGITVPAYAGGNGTNNYNYTTKPTAPAEGETKYVMATFDAKNTGKGMPMMVHISGGGVAYGIDILSRDEMFNKWYTYKVLCEETAGATNLRVTKVLRKAEDATTWEEYNCYFKTELPAEEWATQPVAGWWNKDDCTAAKFYVAGSLSTGVGNIRFGYSKDRDPELNGNNKDSAAYPGMTSAELQASTAWEVRNVQVVNDCALFTGNVEAGVSTFSIDGQFAAASAAATTVLAVYDATTNALIDVAYAPDADAEGDVELTVDYAEGNIVKLFVWDSITAGNPLLFNVLDLTPAAE